MNSQDWDWVISKGVDGKPVIGIVYNSPGSRTGENMVGAGESVVFPNNHLIIKNQKIIDSSAQIFVGREQVVPEVCGNTVCESGENCASCPSDCGCLEGSFCVDGNCKVPMCGDGTCNGGETQETCCQDCGCPSGQECKNNICVAPAVCRDGICNGDETTGTCCVDCGCSVGQRCVENKCIYCGDGVCNGDETQITCCKDCGCPSKFQSCTNLGCVYPPSNKIRLRLGDPLNYSTPYNNYILNFTGIVPQGGLNLAKIMVKKGNLQELASTAGQIVSVFSGELWLRWDNTFESSVGKQIIITVGHDPKLGNVVPLLGRNSCCNRGADCDQGLVCTYVASANTTCSGKYQCQPTISKSGYPCSVDSTPASSFKYRANNTLQCVPVGREGHNIGIGIISSSACTTSADCVYNRGTAVCAEIPDGGKRCWIDCTKTMYSTSDSFLIRLMQRLPWLARGKVMTLGTGAFCTKTIQGGATVPGLIDANGCCCPEGGCGVTGGIVGKFFNIQGGPSPLDPIMNFVSDILGTSPVMEDELETP